VARSLSSEIVDFTITFMSVSHEQMKELIRMLLPVNKK
jgi:hypothetical protein